MENKGNLILEESNIQKLLDRYLRLRVSGKNQPNQDEQHLDEDSLAAFVEGSLFKREVQPVVSHLVNCSFCRNITAELVKLNSAFAAETAQIPTEKGAASSISEVLQGLFVRIFPSGDNTVFAHQEAEEEKTEENNGTETK